MFIGINWLSIGAKIWVFLNKVLWVPLNRTFIDELTAQGQLHHRVILMTEIAK
jgi:hypothetical protein